LVLLKEKNEKITSKSY